MARWFATLDDLRRAGDRIAFEQQPFAHIISRIGLNSYGIRVNRREHREPENASHPRTPVACENQDAIAYPSLVYA